MDLPNLASAQVLRLSFVIAVQDLPQILATFKIQTQNESGIQMLSDVSGETSDDQNPQCCHSVFASWSHVD